MNTWTDIIGYGFLAIMFIIGTTFHIFTFIELRKRSRNNKMKMGNNGIITTEAGDGFTERYREINLGKLNFDFSCTEKPGTKSFYRLAMFNLASEIRSIKPYQFIRRRKLVSDLIFLAGCVPDDVR